MHLLVLRALANALRQRWGGRRVRRAGMLGAHELGIVVEAPEPATLVLSVRPGAPHVRVAGRPRFRRALTDQLGGAAQAVAGARIDDIVPLGWERILMLELAPHPGAAVRQPLRLFLELLPRTPYLAICAGEPPDILASIRAPGTRRPDRRSMERGAPYELPFGIALPELLADPREAARHLLRGALAAGRGPAAAGSDEAGEPAAAARSAAARSAAARSAAARSAAAPAAAALPAAAERLRGVTADELAAATAGATSVEDLIGRLVGFAGPIRVGVDPGAAARAETSAGGQPALWPAARDDERAAGTAGSGQPQAPPPALAPIQAVDAWIRRLDRHEETARARKALHAYHRRERRRLDRSRRAAERDRAETSRRDQLRRHAETLLAHLHLVRPGQRQVSLPDVRSGETIELELDPRLQPAAAAAAMFRRAARLERRLQQLDRRFAAIEQAEGELEAIAQLLADDDDAALRQLAREMEERGQLEPAALEPPSPGRTAGGRGAEGRRRLPYRSIRLAGGWEVRVGRSNADNDILTHRLAAASDLWLHAYAASGAHVVLRRVAGRTGDVPPHILERAAGIAAHFSRARHSKLVPVIVAERRHVRKPRRSPPGTAVCLQERTLIVKPWDPGQGTEAE